MTVIDEMVWWAFATVAFGGWMAGVGTAAYLLIDNLWSIPRVF